MMQTCRILGVCAALAVLDFNVLCGPPNVRETTNGPVEGVQEKTSMGNKTYFAFKGIPYAEAPITGDDPYTKKHVDRRFKAPEEINRKWSKTAHDFGDKCVPSSFMMPFESKISENCLFLNIYVPADGATKKAVVVFIHGGAFTEGNGDSLVYGPDFLLNQDVVVVTINYRVGIFGFLNLGFGEYTGNMGLKDQQMALKWIHANIEHFSGNKDEILLFGESAGGASVHFQMLNEESRKYFKRAFLMSSTAFNFYALSEQNHMSDLREFTGISDQNALIEYLKSADSHELDKCRARQAYNDYTLVSYWVPTIEPKSHKSFITEMPEKLYSVNPPVMDTMFSFTSEEYYTFKPEIFHANKPLLDTGLHLELPFHSFTNKSHPIEYKQAIEALKHAYSPDVNDVDDVRQKNIGLLSDLNFRYEILKTVKLQTSANNKGSDKTKHRNTFLFNFGVSAELNVMKNNFKITSDGAAHAEDIFYLFHSHMLDHFGLYQPHLKHKKSGSNVCYDTIVRMAKMVANFAKTGNPSVENDTPFKPCTANQIVCQNINNNPISDHTEDILQQTHYDTWHKIEESYRKSR